MKDKLDELLEAGCYRLRIDGRTYESVDKATLIGLLERGALLGYEELAEVDGPFIPVREHPLFARLRATMRRELHELFGELDIAAAPLVSPAEAHDAADGLAPQPRSRLYRAFEFALFAALIPTLLVLFAIFALIISRAYL